MQLLHLMTNNVNSKGIRNFLCLLALDLTFTTCVSEVEFKEIDTEDKFVINTLITCEEPIEIYLCKLSGILNDSFEVINNQNINLYENDELKWSDNNGIDGKYLTEITPIVGKRYKLELTDNNGNLISSFDTLPEKVKITDATNLYPVYSDNFGTTFGKITLTFTDEPKIRNYYEIGILNENNGIVQTLKVKSPVITYDFNHNPNPTATLLFTDELFEGKPLTLEIFSDSYKPSVVLKNVSRNYYEYRKSINIHFYNQNVERYDVYSMFKGDPVELYSNVTNGLGIFAGYTQDIKKCTPNKN